MNTYPNIGAPRSKNDIEVSLAKMQADNAAAQNALSDTASVLDYQALVTESDGYSLWTAAFQAAIDRHQIIVIPRRDEPYYIDQTLVVPSNRSIVAVGAHIRKVPSMCTVLLRNEHIHDGSHAPISGEDRDVNISVSGGIWEDTDPNRALYHGTYDADNSMPGLDACLFFGNAEKITLRDLKIVQAGGFGIQLGSVTDGIIENIEFERTVADGVHINGNTRNLIVRNIRGSVADDIVAFNMYDWQRSSICFGPTENVLCENISLSPESAYKAIRVLPGTYFYDDGSSVDCAIRDVIIRGVRGISAFKFYFQTPPYPVGGMAEGGTSGSGDNLFLEDIEITLDKPIDAFREYVEGDPTLGTFAAFELGSTFGRIEMRNIRVKINAPQPTACFACIGPKSIRRGDKEIFDPSVDSRVDTLVLENIEVNGTLLSEDNARNHVREIVFQDLYGEPVGTHAGKIEQIVVL